MLNKATLIGNLGKDPEIRSTNAGKKIVSFSLATSESWKDKQTGHKMDRTEWHRVVVFNERLAEIVDKYLRKGSKVYLEGKIQTRKWTDTKGVDRYSTEIVLADFDGKLVMLGDPGGKREPGEDHEETPHQSAPSAGNARGSANFDDDIPF